MSWMNEASLPAHRKEYLLLSVPLEKWRPVHIHRHAKEDKSLIFEAIMKIKSPQTSAVYLIRLKTSSGKGGLFEDVTVGAKAPSLACSSPGQRPAFCMAGSHHRRKNPSSRIRVLHEVVSWLVGILSLREEFTSNLWRTKAVKKVVVTEKLCLCFPQRGIAKYVLCQQHLGGYSLLESRLSFGGWSEGLRWWNWMLTAMHPGR